MVRLSLVNLYLHGFTDPHIFEYDTLTSEERWNELSDVILANPPFVSPTGGIKPHRRFSIQAKRSEVLTEHGPCDRDTAIKQAATSLGYQRVRAGLSTTLINAIRTAVKRQVLSNQGGQLSLSVSSISGYEMDFLCTIHYIAQRKLLSALFVEVKLAWVLF